MFFTPAERRLLTFLVLLLSGGFVLTGLRRLGVLPAPGSAHIARQASAPGPVDVQAQERGLPGGEPSPAPPWRVPRMRAVANSPFIDGHLDLNLADSLDLVALPGVGPVLARRILTLRQQRRGFRKVDELLDVKGIGRKRLARLSQYLKVK